MAERLGKYIFKIREYFLNPLPSFFDLCVVLGIIPISYIYSQYRGIYLVFFSIFIMCLSTYFKEKRVLRNIWMMLILLWSFLGVFIHSWMLNIGGAYNWVNYCLMSEGFIYLFFSIWFLRTVSTHSVNLRWLWFTIPFAIYPIVVFMLRTRQMSFLLSFALATLIYLIMTKRYKIFIVALIFTIVLVISKYQWILFKWNCRPYSWIELGRQIMEHPFVGTGYNKTLIPDNMMWIRQIGNVVYGWLWRQNDYLSIASFLGLPILIPIAMFLKDLFMRFRKFAYVVLFMAFCLTSFMQITMFVPEKALIVITLLSFFYSET